MLGNRRGGVRSEEEPLNADDLDALMRAGEVYHNLRVPPGCWAIVRVDGRSFTALTKKHYVHPFDELFHLAMVAAAIWLVLMVFKLMQKAMERSG